LSFYSERNKIDDYGTGLTAEISANRPFIDGSFF
jgi:hypothetical protein